MSDPRDKPNDRALQEFLSEAQEIVESFNRDLLALESESGGEGGAFDPERLNNIYRAIHSLKGLSGLFNLGPMTQLTHHLEDLLDSLRLGKVPLSGELLDVLFEAVELLTRLTQSASTGGQGDGNEVTDFIMALDRVAVSGRTPASKVDALESCGLDPGILAVLTEYEEHRLRENLRLGVVLYWIRADFDKLTIDLALEDIRGQIKRFGEIITCVPTDSSDDAQMALEFLLGTRSDAAGLNADLSRVAGLKVVPVTARAKTAPLKGSTLPSLPGAPPAPLPRPPAREPAPSPSAAQLPDTSGVFPGPLTGRPAKVNASLPPDDERATTLRSASQTVRVDIRKLDHLMNLIGELGIARASMHRAVERMRRQLGRSRGRAVAVTVEPEVIDELHRDGRSLERKLNELQSGILEVRMVPLGQLFDKLSRVVRKISRDVGKEIRFQVEGGDTELDKLIVEELSDPLMHIIRNGIDHGIEEPEQRHDLGKPAQGTLRLAALQKGNHVLIEISDDGAGLDEEKIRRLAVERGILDPETARNLARREVYNLIFLPGFSTKGVVSEVSGRGVGMDVVKTNISKLSGIIDIHSDHGVGTSITLTLPITLAIIPALIISAGGQTYAIPLNSVLESVAVTPGEVKTLSRHEVISLRGATLPLLRLTEIFGLGASPPTARLYVVVVGVAQHRMGIVVDTLVGQQDIVIKSLGRALSRVRGIAGATELGGQQTVLVLDVAALVEETLGGNTQVAA